MNTLYLILSGEVEARCLRVISRSVGTVKETKGVIAEVRQAPSCLAGTASNRCSTVAGYISDMLAERYLTRKGGPESIFLLQAS